MLRLIRMKTGLRRFLTFSIAVAMLAFPPAGNAYSVLSHEEVVDMAWKPRLVPMLRARFPGISEDDLRQAHAYAYGGSVIQDLGYYPFGSHYFSDLLHYVRPNEFVDALIRDSTTPNEYAFALGALAHFCGDTVGHPAINAIVAEENPPLQTRFGSVVTYAENPTAHVRTEFGFDVAEVAQGHYSQQNYRDFIGFKVARPLLDRAFAETYGIPVSDVLPHEDLAISTYRRSVSSLIPNLTKLAFASYKNQIQQATPGMQRRKFLYRLNQTDFEKEFGNQREQIGVRGHIAEFFLHIVPKVGPFKALKVTIPNAREQDAYIKSMNATVDRFQFYLAEIHAAPAPLPPVDAAQAGEARKVADKLEKEAGHTQKQADKAADPAEKAQLEKVAENVQKTADMASASADRTQAKVEAAEAASLGLVPPAHTRVPASTPITPPTTPKLPNLDLDTGKPLEVGEYVLANKTYARLLNELVTRPGPVRAVDAALAADILQFYAHPAPQQVADEKDGAAMVRVSANLATLKTMGAPPSK